MNHPLSTEESRPRQWDPLSLVPLAAGLVWLLAGDGPGWLLCALVPGTLLVGTGCALLLMPGNPRITALMAVGALAGMILLLPAWIAGGSGPAFLVFLGSLGSALAAGRAGLLREPRYEGAVTPQLDTRMDLKAAVDEAVLGYFVVSARVPNGEAAARACDDAIALEQALEARGWMQDGAGMHAAPPPPERSFVGQGRIYGHAFETVRFDSGFAPDPALPGAAAWMSRESNHQCHARILRHPGPPRPWLVCVHGYRMGFALADFALFSPEWLHHRLGLNILQPVLPLHGPRSATWRSGDFFLDGDLTDLVYAEMQCLWDLRRTLAWLRQSEQGARIGVFGISLGGYNAALLAGFEDGLEFVVAGIPVIDFASALWRFMPPAHARYFGSRGIDAARYRRILAPISPVSFAPRLPPERRHIVGAAGDRIVVPHHPVQLARHWDVPVTWYQGSHLSVRREAETHDVLRRAISGAGWAVA